MFSIFKKKKPAETGGLKKKYEYVPNSYSYVTEHSFLVIPSEFSENYDLEVVKEQEYFHLFLLLKGKDYRCDYGYVLYSCNESEAYDVMKKNKIDTDDYETRNRIEQNCRKIDYKHPYIAGTYYLRQK